MDMYRLATTLVFNECLPEEDPDGSKHVGVNWNEILTNCVYRDSVSFFCKCWKCTV
jgi:hypothetical protein